MATVREPVRTRADAVTILLVVVGVVQVATGVLAFFAPGAFYDLVAAYPPENHHFLKDLGSWQIALGAIALYGARRPDWRVPLLALLALQYALHTVSHVIDLHDPEAAWQGWFALITQGLGAVLLGGLFLRERAR